MHRVKKSRGRSMMLLLVVLAAVALFGILVQSAMALPTFNKAEKSIGPCDKCHSMAAVHAVSNHASMTCETCHKVNTATPPLPSTCASCHGPVAGMLTTVPHKAASCGTTDGCHGYVAPAEATIAIDTVKPNKVVKLKSTISFSGGVTPIDTPATSVAWVIEQQSGKSWKQVKAGTATLGFLGGAMRFAYSYKATKKGNFRTSASFFPLLGGAKVTSKAILFKVK